MVNDNPGEFQIGLLVECNTINITEGSFTGLNAIVDRLYRKNRRSLYAVKSLFLGSSDRHPVLQEAGSGIVIMT
jgi:hypothetical protein